MGCFPPLRTSILRNKYTGERHWCARKSPDIFSMPNSGPIIADV
jgi:hypothetical protein